MKKITLLSVSLFLLSLGGYGQCIRTAMNPPNVVVSDNSGQLQTIVTGDGAFTSEYSELSNLLVGTDYLFTCKLGTVNKYITVTDLDNVVITHGPSPLTVVAITSSQIRLHYSEDPACTSTNNFHSVTVTSLASCSDPITSINENFNTTPLTTLPTCWSAIKNGTGLSESAYVYVRNVPGNTRAVTFFNSDSFDSNIILSSPELSNLDTGTHRAKFFAKCSIPQGSLQVGTVNNHTVDAVFTVKETIDIFTTYTEYTVDFTDYVGTDNYLAFRFNNDGINSTIQLDGIRWEVAPVCTDVSEITIPLANITPATATVSWMSNGTETEWDLVYGPASVTDPTTLTPVTPVPTVNPTTTLTGLTDNTSYKVWVRSACESNDGAWVGPVIFKTPCVPATSINETFDTTPTGTLPSCWTFVKNGDFTPNAKVWVLNAFTGGNLLSYSPLGSIVMEPWLSPLATSNLMLVSPPLSNLSAGTHRLRFYARKEYGTPGSLQVGTIDTNTADGSFTSLETIQLSNRYAEYIVEYPATDVTSPYIAFRYNSLNLYEIYIDNIVWEAIPSCQDVLLAPVTDLTSATANITWTSGDIEANFQVAYGPVTTTDPATLTPTDLLTTTSYSISGLVENTAYAVWVRSVCGTDDNGSWFGPTYFRTSCSAATVPFTEDFESAPSPGISCGTLQDFNPFAGVFVTGYNGGDFNSRILACTWACYEGPNDKTDAWYFTRGVALTGDVPYTISYKVGAGVGFDNPALMKLMYGNSPDAADMTQELSVEAIGFNTPEMRQFSFIPESTGVYFFGFHNFSEPCSLELRLDDITVEEALGKDDFNASEFKIYPNPVKDILNLSHTQDISNVAIYNLLGQKVIKNTINTARIDMSALATGSYIVKITTSENQTETYKVVKE